MRYISPRYPLLLLAGLATGCTLDLGAKAPEPPAPIMLPSSGVYRPCPTLPESCRVQCPTCRTLSTVDLRGLSTGSTGAVVGAKIQE